MKDLSTVKGVKELKKGNICFRLHEDGDIYRVYRKAPSGAFQDIITLKRKRVESNEALFNRVFTEFFFEAVEYYF